MEHDEPNYYVLQLTHVNIYYSTHCLVCYVIRNQFAVWFVVLFELRITYDTGAKTLKTSFV